MPFDPWTHEAASHPGGSSSRRSTHRRSVRRRCLNELGHRQQRRAHTRGRPRAANDRHPSTWTLHMGLKVWTRGQVHHQAGTRPRTPTVRYTWRRHTIITFGLSTMEHPAGRPRCTPDRGHSTSATTALARRPTTGPHPDTPGTPGGPGSAVRTSLPQSATPTAGSRTSTRDPGMTNTELRQSVRSCTQVVGRSSRHPGKSFRGSPDHRERRTTCAA